MRKIGHVGVESAWTETEGIRELANDDDARLSSDAGLRRA